MIVSVPSSAFGDEPVTGGHSLYLKDGKPKYAYNFFGLDEYAGRRHRSRSRPASTRCGWSSPTTAAASARAVT